MTAPPGSPGRGLPVYQPATAVVVGTCSAPVLVRPRWMSRVLTSMAGMTRLTGSATAWLTAGGTAAHLPLGSGAKAAGLMGAMCVAGWPVRLAAVKPATPAPRSEER